MDRALTWTCAVLLALGLVACGRSDPEPETGASDEGMLDSVIGIGNLRISSDAVTIRQAGEPDARILSGGRLLIGGEELPVTEAQGAYLREYHGAAMLLREHGKETGIAGAKVGLAAVGAVIGGLVKGEPDSIGPKVEAEAEKVKQAALKLCGDIATMRRAQDSLAEDLEAFRPYATLDESDEIDCRDDVYSSDPPDEPAGAPPPGEEAPSEKPQLI